MFSSITNRFIGRGNIDAAAQPSRKDRRCRHHGSGLSHILAVPSVPAHLRIVSAGVAAARSAGQFGVDQWLGLRFQEV